MVSLVRERLRFRPALLDFVLVDSSRKLERLWGGLARSTGREDPPLGVVRATGGLASG